MIKLSGAYHLKTTTVKHLVTGGKCHVNISHKYTQNPLYHSSLSNQAGKNRECLVCSPLSTLTAACPSSSFYIHTGEILRCFTDFFTRSSGCYPKVHPDRASLPLDCLHLGCLLHYLLPLVPSNPPYLEIHC